MHIEKISVPHARSYTSIYDLLSNFSYKHTRRNNNDIQSTCGDNENVKVEAKEYTQMINSTEYVTSEKYHFLNKEYSLKSIAKSTSTIFYDLDDFAKRHSFHCFNDVSSSKVNLLKVMTVPIGSNGFNGKLDAIVQECATQLQPKLARDSIEINSKRIKKGFPHERALSSEINLRDDDFYEDDLRKCYYDKEMTDRQQKFWSFAKYRTEYTKPIPEEKKRKKKDRGKRTEDPCPCQLFSYACPCTDKKSLTELAKSSKSLTVADQKTSTSKLEDSIEIKNNHRSKKSKNLPTEDKQLSTEYVEEIENYEHIATKNEPAVEVTRKHEILNVEEIKPNESASNKSRTRSIKKRRKITCPRCRENLDLLLSTTDEEESMKYTISSLYRFKDNSSKHKCCKSSKHKTVIAEDNCDHEPRCELVPVCQILPTDNIYMSHNFSRKQSKQKTSPKIIRITKACRHHPPCTVVPACQRANVLKNNCEYIPPCLHRPRCVNLPLCVPQTNIYYDEPVKNNGIENVECPHIPKCRYYPECQYETVGNKADNDVNVTQVQNACEFLTEYQHPFVLSPKATCPQKMSSQSPVILPTCHCCRSNKSCQFNSLDCKCQANSTAISKNTESTEAVIFIRDVGCQFRNKKCSPKGSDQLSSASFDLVDVKMGNYYSNKRTLRCEDKSTNPMVDEDLSEISVSIISLEIDSHCPTHGERAPRRRSERATGFIPKQNTTPFVAYITERSSEEFPQMYSTNNELSNARSHGQGHSYNTYSVKSRRSFLRTKCKKMFGSKRRRKSRVSSVQLSSLFTRNHSVVPN